MYRKLVLAGLAIFFGLVILSYPLTSSLQKNILLPISDTTTISQNKTFQAVLFPWAVGYYFYSQLIQKPLDVVEIKNRLQNETQKHSKIKLVAVEANDSGFINALLVFDNKYKVYLYQLNNVSCFTKCNYIFSQINLDERVIATVKPLATSLEYAKERCLSENGCRAENVSVRTLPFEIHNYQEYFSRLSEIIKLAENSTNSERLAIKEDKGPFYYSF